MGITSVVAVADNIGIEGGGLDVVYTPGDPYPPSGQTRLFVRDQPFPHDPPNRVVVAVTSVCLSYGRFGEGSQPPPLEPDEHWLRELGFDAGYRQGSWAVSGNEASIDVGVTCRLRDNTPGGEQSEPDDAFVAHVDLEGLCIWTTVTLTLLERIERAMENVRALRP
jgi:hypothetical protein